MCLSNKKPVKISFIKVDKNHINRCHFIVCENQITDSTKYTRLSFSMCIVLLLE